MDQQFILKKLKQTLTKTHSNNLLDIAKANQITVLYYPLGSTYGFYSYMKKNKVILINNELTEIQQKFVLAHEIGHALLHTKVNCAFISQKTYLKADRYEIEANYFGAQLLKAIGTLEEHDFCIQDSEISSKDSPFLEMLRLIS